MTDYSQSGEQAYILDWAKARPPGRWLDIGAADGVSASNTRALAEQNYKGGGAWGGVAVEPAASLFDRLTTLYHERRDVECVQAAVVTGIRKPLVRFHYSRDLLSTTEQKNYETWSDFSDFTPCYVATVTVEQLLAFFPGPYDLVSIDTEGTSVEIFNALRERDAFERHALAVVEAEDGEERWEIQRACVEGWARTAVTPNNVLLERL